jgi:hypothetical protein
MNKTERLQPDKIVPPVQPKETKPLTGIINKPFFGVYLGESFENISRRFIVSNQKIKNSDPDDPSVLYKIENLPDNVSFMGVSVFIDKVYLVCAYLKDNSDDNYSAVREELINKYGKSKDADGFMEKKSLWNVEVDGIPVEIFLTLKNNVDSKTLSIFYTHTGISKQVENMSTQRKKNKIKDNL